MPNTWVKWMAATALCVGVATSAVHAAAPAPEAVMTHYADIAEAMFRDAHAAALDLQKAVDALIAKPSPETLAAARKAWIDARPWYQQSEGFRFGNPVVDAWEGRVNSWPLDEGLIDYVATESYGEESDENPFYVANAIANPKLKIGNDEIDLTSITPESIKALQEAGGNEANVAIGYHAIEFLLWGQDLNGTKAGAGNRPYTDYDAANCTNGNCDRRAAFLKAVTDLLVADLAEMANDWAAGGAARSELAAKPARDGLGVILTGLGSLSYGELAGERMRLGLILHDPEEEQDCFSDNTHNSHYFDQAGMWAIYSGTYTRRDGSRLDGPGLQDLASEEAPADAKALDTRMQDTLAKMQAMKDRADSGKEAYDQMIAAGNTEGNAVVQAAIDGLIAQTHAIEALVTAMKLSIKVEGSDSLDNPSAVNAQ